MQGRTTQEEGGRKPAGSKVVLAAFLPAVAWLAGLQSVMAGIGEWTSSGPGGGTVQALAIDPRNTATLYAGGVGSGVFKSADGGRSWSAVNDGLTNLTILDLAIDPSTTPSTVYAATGGSGVFRSTDGGESWSQIGPPVPGPNAYVVAVDPVVPTTLYACIRAWLMKSTDAGMSWTTGSTGAENVSDLAIDAANPSTIYAAGAMATPTGGGLYKTLDGGATWRKVTWGLFDASGRDYDVSRVAIDPSSTSIVYITTAGGVFKSIDGGTSWTSKNNGLQGQTVGDLAIDPVTTATLYVGAWGGVFKSTDGGDVWAALGQGLAGRSVSDLVVDPQTPTTLYAATDAGVFSLQQVTPPGDGTRHERTPRR